jgi:hypothetical protein
LTTAFDAAWEHVAPGVGTRPQAIEAARLKLADVILGLAGDGIMDAAQMTEAALNRMVKP